MGTFGTIIVSERTMCCLNVNTSPCLNCGVRSTFVSFASSTGASVGAGPEAHTWPLDIPTAIPHTRIKAKVFIENS